MIAAHELLISLNQVKVGEECSLIDYQGDQFILDRLIELGFVRGERLKITHKTLFGDFAVQVKGTEIALRREEARCLVVKYETK